MNKPRSYGARNLLRLFGNTQRLTDLTDDSQVAQRCVCLAGSDVNGRPVTELAPDLATNGRGVDLAAEAEMLTDNTRDDPDERERGEHSAEVQDVAGFWWTNDPTRPVDHLDCGLGRVKPYAREALLRLPFRLLIANNVPQRDR